MSSLIGALRVTLGADTADFERGMSRAERAGHRTGVAIKSSMGAIKTALTGFAAGVGAAGVIALAQRGLELASSLGEVAQQLGVTTDELQEYRYAASQAGVDQDTMDKSLAKLTRTIGQAATGGKAQQKIFEALGISVRDANGHVRTAGDILPEISDALAQIEDPARRAAVQTQLFGRAGQQLDPLLSGGSQALNELRDAAHELGIVLSADQIARADETADKLSAVKQVLEARIAGVVADNADSILLLADAFAKLVEWAGRAAQAYRRFKLEQGARLEENRAEGWFTPAREREAARARAAQYRAEIARMDGTQDKTGAFRDYRAAPLFPNQKGGGAPTTTEPDISNISGGGGNRTPRSNSGRDRQNAIRDQYRNEDALRDLQIDELRAREDLTYDIKERAALAQQQLELEQAGERAQIQQQVDLKDISEAEGKKQLASLAIVQALQKEALTRDEEYALLQEQFRLEDSLHGMTADRLQIEAALARTARDRREVAMRILDHEIAEERRKAQQVLDNPRASADDRSAAERAMIVSEQTEGGRREAVRRNTMSPLESYLDSLPRTADEANEALENVAAGGIQSIVDGLTDAATGAENLGDVFSNIARQIIADLIRIQIQKAIVGALGNVLGFSGGPMIGGQTGAQFSAGLGSTLSQAASSVRIPGLASGGMFPVGGRPGVDTNLLSINGQPRARVSASEHIAVLPNNGGGGRSSSTVTIVPTPYFDAVVDGRAAAVSRPMAAAAGMAGGALGEQRMMSRSRRRIP